jgi:Tfp pilus assembly protein PilF
MKKIIISSFMICAAITVSVAQSNQVQNAFNYLKTKEYDKAKISADAASEHASTTTSAKTWMYRGKIYKAIYEDKDPNVKKLDANSEEKALQSFVKCLELDKGKDIYKDEVKGLLVQSAYALNQKFLFQKDNKEFDAAINSLEILITALPYDYDQGMKRNNVTKETIMFNRYKTLIAAGQKDKAKAAADELIGIKYKDVSIYTEMVKVSLIDKDTAQALSYIQKGKVLFEDNMALANQEINIYLARKKTNELKDKLLDAISYSPDNEVLHALLANVYEKSGDIENAEKSYLKAVEIKPDYDLVNYNLGAMYFNRGNEWNKKLNDLPPKETAKAKEYEAKSNENFKKAAQYLESYYEVSLDKGTKQQLRKLFLLLGETEKADKYK